ncbi:MAG: pirin family protein [Thiohalocapsa sp.]|nr:pirin family protein [Thiohalocapsa sp.]
MISIRKAGERGHANLGWLDSYHSFSFGSYYDPRQMGVSNLRVINDDRIAPGSGFPTHGHRDMEIVTYVMEGALEHKDSMGNGSVIRAGDVQYMSAGTGVRHSEYNPSEAEPVHLLQIWLTPNRIGGEPGYSQQHFPPAMRRNTLALVVSPDGRDGSIRTHQDALMYAAKLDDCARVEHRLAPGRPGYLHLARGAARVDGELLSAGDGARIAAGATIRIDGVDGAELLLFDLP